MDERPGSAKIGVFGGAFDPIHIGHLAAAQEVAEEMQLDRVLFLPALQPPHKDAAGLTSAVIRMGMVREAIGDHPLFEMSDIECRRPPPSFTVDTLRQLAAMEPATWHLILGADQWGRFGGWREPDQIATLAELVLVTREGERPADIDPGLASGARPPFREVPITRIDVSSTLVRRRVREGRSIRYLVPDGVRRIIEAEKLYR